MKSALLLLPLTSFLVGNLSRMALADEVWDTEEYQVIYEEDRGRTAIWSYGDGLGTIFIDGLAGEFTDRDAYSGYWVQETASLRCDTYREGADGEPTYYWGQFELVFNEPDFPSSWQAKIGRCDQEPFVVLNGIPALQEPLPEQPINQSNKSRP